MDVVTEAPPTPPANAWDRLTATPRALIGWTVAALIGNILIIVTGAFVRLTASGLGCPTWPKCQPSSYVPQGATGHHEYVEFGNRTLTFVLIFLGAMLVVATIRSGADQFARTLAIISLAGIPFQGVIGGITVLTKLNPYVVALHLLLSLVLVSVLTRLLMHVTRTPVVVVSPAARAFAVASFVGMAVACWLGTVVTGSGPHSGDGGAKRTGLDILTVARVHSVSVWLTVAATVATLVLVQRAGNSAARWAWLLLAVEIVQGAIGYYQFFHGVPLVPVLLHMLGAGLAVAAASALFFGTRKAL